MNKTIYTFSSLRTFQTCPMLYFYKYILGYRTVKVDAPLQFGLVIHKWLETLNQDYDLENRYPLEDEFENAKFRALTKGYLERYNSHVDEEYDDHEPEKIFEIDLASNPKAKVAGKLDDLFFVDAGIVVLVEHKTSGEDIRPGSYYWQKLQMDTQIGLYWLALLAMGYLPKYVLYNVIGKPRLRPSKTKEENGDQFYNRLCDHIAKNPDQYYQRGKVRLLKKDLKNLKVDILRTIETIEFHEKENIWPRYTGNCYKYNRPCSFFPVCIDETNLNNIEHYYQSDVLHPELEKENNNND